jgi:excisionase family DNA binding protein
MGQHEDEGPARLRAPSLTGTPGRLYTCDQVAEMLGVGTDWVRRRTQLREVEHVRLGRRVRFTDTQVLALIERFTKRAVRQSTARARL